MPVSETVGSHKVIGKKVLSRDGENLGVVAGLYLDPEALTVEAIEVNKGLFSGRYYIGREYIDTLTPKGAVLNILPIKELQNKKVFDNRGHELGRVKDFKRSGKTNKFSALIVDRGVTEKDLLVPQKQIAEIGKNIKLTIKAPEK